MSTAKTQITLNGQPYGLVELFGRTWNGFSSQPAPWELDAILLMVDSKACWRMGRSGAVMSRIHTSIPENFRQACMAWMLCRGFGDMALRDFLSSLGVIE